MPKLTKQEANDLFEFLLSLDWKKINDNEVELVSNRFNLNELPEIVKNYIEGYLEAIELID